MLGRLFKLTPARQAIPSDDTRVIVDLDRVVNDPVGFRWKGKVHLIKPMDTKTFLKVTNELAGLEALRKKPEKVSQKEILLAYWKVFHAAVGTISWADIQDMTLPQIGILTSQIMECVSGKAYADSAQKKTLESQPTEQAAV
jgi:hypothetical protein